MVEQVKKALEALRRGGLIAYPTDTIYGLGADCRDLSAVRRIFATKRRPLSMPLPLIVADAAMLHEASASLPSDIISRLAPFMPGPLTIVVRKASWVPDLITADGPTVALRIPNHPVPRALALGLGAPIIGTSANRSGSPGVTAASDVVAALGDDLDVVIDGECLGGIASTVLDLTHGAPRIVRVGAISKESLEAVIGDLAIA